MSLRVHWITAKPVDQTAGAARSAVASLRYRVLLPVERTDPGRFSHRVFASAPDTYAGLAATVADCDVLVFSKSVMQANEGLARFAQARGAKVLFDVCDNHYQHPVLGEHYRAMTGLADQVVCNTEEMAKVVRGHAAREPLVIDDPLEGPRGAAAFMPGERLKLLWFGHPLNLGAFAAALDDLAAFAQRRPLAVTLLTEVSDVLRETCRSESARHGPSLVIEATPWSLEAQWRALAACDAVILPHGDRAASQAKSANRLVTALWAGRPVAAHPIPAYAPFAGWTPVRPTLSAGLDALLEGEADAPALVEAAQTHIAVRYAPDVLAKQWAGALVSTAASAS